jgi:hypothetical protein
VCSSDLISVRPVAAVHLRVPLSGVENEDTSAVTVRQMLFDTIPVPIHTESRRAGSGSVAISGIPPGQYVLDVNLWNETRNSTAASLEIEAGPDGQLVAGGDRALARVSGTVKMENPASPVPQGGVQLRSRKTAAVYTAQMSPKGEFEFRQLIPAGDYSVDLSGARSAFVKLVAGAGAAGETVQIRGKAPVKLTVELTEGPGRIDGVVQHEGKPLAAAMIVLVPEDPANNPGRFRRDQSDSDGTFTLASILPGKYTVLAIEKGWDLEWADPEVLKPYLEKGEAVRVEARGKLKVKLEAQ